jgi:hypothetical protein
MSAESCGKAMRTSPGSSADDGAASPVAAAPVSVPVVEGALGGTIAAVVVLPVFEAGAGGAMPPEAPVLDPLVPEPLVPDPLVLDPLVPSGGGGGGGAIPPLLPAPLAVAVEAVCVELPLEPEAGAVVLPASWEGGGGVIEGAVGGGEGGGGGVEELVSELAAELPLLSEVEGAAGAVAPPMVPVSVEAVSVELGAAGAVLCDATAGAWLGCAAARGT